MDLSRDTSWEFVVLQGQTNLVLILRVEQTHIKVDLLSIVHILGKLEEFVEELRAHAAADSIVALNFGESLAADQEVSAHHVHVTVPSLQVMHYFTLLLRECESEGYVCYALLVRDPEHMLFDLLLFLEYSHD